MSHKPIQIKNLELSFPYKLCFHDFNTQIHPGARIAIVGRNGSGKSSLLKILANQLDPSDGSVTFDHDLRIGYVPQIIETYSDISGGERFNASLTESLSSEPDILLLDEPTNHLDRKNRNNLMRMLKKYQGTLIIVSHDPELLRNCIDTIWHIDFGKITTFTGNYDDYILGIKAKRSSIEHKLSQLECQKREMHDKLMQEQSRAAKSRAKGEKSIDKRKWPTIVSAAKARRAEETAGRKKSALERHKSDLIENLAELRLPEIIAPKFTLGSGQSNNEILVHISDGGVGYDHNHRVLSDINLTLASAERMAIIGANASGKTTLIRAIRNDASVIRSGHWYAIPQTEIGYLDQHYSTLHPDKSALEIISEAMPGCTHNEVRRHLNDFLFRKNEEVNCKTSTLSGGEKARLSLALIAAKTPKLLILDEITNNIDLETKEHIIAVLKHYPGAMIVISHDDEFLQEISIETKYEMGYR